jgi:hypothetical protein
MSFRVCWRQLFSYLAGNKGDRGEHYPTVTVQGSYMPVFTAGAAIASSLATALNVQIITTSHQEGHLAAGIESAEGFTATEFSGRPFVRRKTEL